MDDLALACFFFLHPFHPQEVVSVLAAFPAPVVYETTIQTRYYGKALWETLRFAELLVEGRILKWSRSRWVNEVTMRLDGEHLSTLEHAMRSERLMQGFGRYLLWTAEEVEDGKLAAGIHDVGKLCMPTSILEKPGPLTPEEMTIMRKHLDWSIRFVKWIPGFKRIVPIIADHHEWFNGTGYPKGSRRKEISEVTHALAIVDAYDAMTNARYYRPARSQEEAFQELWLSAGTQFDPEIVQAFVDFMKHGGPDTAQPDLLTPGGRWPHEQKKPKGLYLLRAA